eukprot:1076317-Pleurochrysis_carterae.AAC.3
MIVWEATRLPVCATLRNCARVRVGCWLPVPGAPREHGVAHEAHAHTLAPSAAAVGVVEVATTPCTQAGLAKRF